jgi:type IV secretory pathway VirB6-like protein
VADPLLRRAALVLFFGYAATLVLAGAWGAVAARLDFSLIIGLEPSDIPNDAEADLLNHYRFLRALELCFGLFAIVYWRRIFEERTANTIFLTAMAAGVSARLIGIAVDGTPSLMVFSVVAWEVAGLIVIFLATRTARAG